MLRKVSRASIKQALAGRDVSKLSIVSSAAIVFASFFYVYSIASYFKIPIYFLHNRLVSKLDFTDIYIINKYVDHILIISAIVLWLVISLKNKKARFLVAVSYSGIAIIGTLANILILVDIAVLISIPIVSCLLVYDRFTSEKKILNTDANLSINYFSIMGIVLGIESVIILSALPLFSIQSRSIPLPNYAYGIFVLFSSLSPILMILLINAVPVKILSNEFIKVMSKLKQTTSATSSANSLVISHKKIKLRNKLIYLSLIVLLTLMLVSIPHQPTINKNNRLIGADSITYGMWENTLLKSNNAQDFIQKAFVTLSGGDRPISLIFFFTIIKVATYATTSTVGSSYIIDNLPIILGPALVLVIYSLTRELTSNDVASLFAAFLTAVSFHTLVGIYAGYYANWFALIIGYLALVFVFRFLKSSKKINLIAFFFLTILVLFSHTYTWTILTVVTGIFLLIMLGFKYFQRRSIIFVLLVLLSSVVVDVAKIIMTGSAGGIEQDVSVARRQQLGVGQLPVRWNNLIDTTEIYYGAAFSNVIILALGLYWLFRTDMHDPFNIFLVIFLSIGIFPLFFGNWLIQSRVFYNIPFQIPAAIALTYIKKVPKGNLMLIPICVWLITMCVRTLSNF